MQNLAAADPPTEPTGTLIRRLRRSRNYRRVIS
jgi:hypothetical protein